MENERDEKAEKRADCNRKGRVLEKGYTNIPLLIVPKFDFELGSNQKKQRLFSYSSENRSDGKRK